MRCLLREPALSRCTTVCRGCFLQIATKRRASAGASRSRRTAASVTETPRTLHGFCTDAPATVLDRNRVLVASAAILWYMILSHYSHRRWPDFPGPVSVVGCLRA